MKRAFKSVAATLISMGLLWVIIVPLPARATTNSFVAQSDLETVFSDSTQTTFFGNLEEDDKGCGVYTVLTLVLDILMGIVGIAAVIGISIVGIQYLTAGGNEQQATKAKRRMLEIVIGVVAYIALYSALNFLLPGAKFNGSAACSQASPEPAQEHAPGGFGSDDLTSKEKDLIDAKNGETIATIATRMAEVLEANNYYYGHKRWKRNGNPLCLKSKTIKKTPIAEVSNCSKTVKDKSGQKYCIAKCLKQVNAIDCGGYASGVYNEAYLIKKNGFFAIMNQQLQNKQDLNVPTGQKTKSGKKITKKYTDAHLYNSTISKLVSQGKVKRGDVVGLQGNGVHHTMIYNQYDKESKKYLFFSVESTAGGGKWYDRKNGGPYKKKHIVNRKYGAGTRISWVVSPKRGVLIRYPGSARLGLPPMNY